MLGHVHQCSELAFMLTLSLNGPMLDHNHVIAKDVKSCTYCYYVRFTTLKVWVNVNALAPTGITHYHAQLGLADKGCAIKGIGWMPCSMAMIYVRLMVLWTSARCVVWSLVVVSMAFKLKYCNTQWFIQIYNITNITYTPKIYMHV